MPSISDGARQLPLRHLSIRVPWHDAGWTGCICNKPSENASCLVLKRIRENRNDTLESQLAGKSWAEIEEEKIPPCTSERANFMASRDFTRIVSHPYAKTSKAHNHMLPTPFRHPAYSAACIPFGWMLKEYAEEKQVTYDLGFEQDLENQAHQKMGFETIWVQTKHNQLVMLDTFFSAIQPQRSLCFIYAKRIPLVEESGRIIIGVGFVEHVGEPVEYQYKKEGLDSVIWERSIQHSIRPKFKNGFLFPYHELLEYLKAQPEEDPRDYVAFASEEHFKSFCYASEHVTNDGAIASLLSCNRALENIQKAVEGPWTKNRQWIDARLNELWNMRGPSPGLGAALHAFGIEHGNLLAMELEKLVTESESEDPWGTVDQLFRNPNQFPETVTRLVKPSICRKWESLPEERRQLLKLLSRFELTNEQAACYYVVQDKRRDSFRIDVTDRQLIENPYLLYEADRLAAESIALPMIDRGVFPNDALRNRFPLTGPSQVADPLDERRIRAFTIQQLERAVNEGHTLLPRDAVISQIRGLETEPPCPVDEDMMALAENRFEPEIASVAMADEKPAYQLTRFTTTGALIQKAVKRRLKGKRHQAKIDWREILDHTLHDTPKDEAQESARREEKTTALEELYASRISVLIGAAGTGKTTLLKALCGEKSVKEGGVLALAPTGKARVRFEQQTGVKNAQTIAQFLMPLDRYEPMTGVYRLSDRKPPVNDFKTVIIEEASMLTEEQLAAVLNALTGVERMILLGDPCQLPPIGAGRPFVDIVEELRPEELEAMFPKVAKGYAELTVGSRQLGERRQDLLLADWFSGKPIDPGADEIWAEITHGCDSQFLRFIDWKTPDELQGKLLKTMVEELGLESEQDIHGFEQTLGGSFFNGYVYYHCGIEGKKAGACEKIEDWQILSPVRNEAHGVEALNRFIQNTFRHETKRLANQRWRKTPKPMGREEIVYGDKVINLVNQRRKDVYPKDDALSYVANGEIGVVVGQFKGKNWKPKKWPWKLEVEFASQPCYKYGYGGRDFSEEGEPKLELAYALTVHKVQGSEFGLTFLIAPNPCWLLSRELLYTALTRQKNKVVILHQGDPHGLKRFCSDYFSETARRLTNLFKSPSRVELQDRFLEERLIHRTRRGESVRSKSEVIIADLLYSKGVEYAYEAPFKGKDGQIRYPDFSFEDDETGIKVYWEHLGMIQLPEYRQRWEQKLLWYKNQGILPYHEGEGEEGTLLITQDDERGGIHSDKIESLLDGVLVG